MSGQDDDSRKVLKQMSNLVFLVKKEVLNMYL